MHREREDYYYMQDDHDRSALAATLTRDERIAQDRDIVRRLVPLMGQLGWQLLEDGVHWIRRGRHPMRLARGGGMVSKRGGG
jgi:hypothetical protein